MNDIPKNNIVPQNNINNKLPDSNINWKVISIIEDINYIALMEKLWISNTWIKRLLLSEDDKLIHKIQEALINAYSENKTWRDAHIYILNFIKN